MAFVAVLSTALFELNAKVISDFVTQLSPKLTTITNILDLISFVLVTPKLFTKDIRDNLLHAHTQTLQFYTLGKVQMPHNTITYFIGAFLLLCTFSLFPLFLLYLNDLNFSLLLKATTQFSRIAKLTNVFDASFFDYIAKRMVEVHSVFAAMWPFLGSIMIVYVVFSISVILSSALAKATPAAQGRLDDKLLRWGVVVFLYSRALSMIG